MSDPPALSELSGRGAARPWWLTLAWRCYDALLCVFLAGWLVWRLLVSPWRGLKVIAEALGFVPRRPRATRVAVWVHAVSVGELSSARPVLAELKRRHPDWWILLTVLQGHAYRLAIERPTGADAVSRLPCDLTVCIDLALDRVRPDVLVLVECELWPNLIVRTATRGARVMVINGRIYERSFPRYLWARRFFEPVMKSIAFIGAQSEADRQRFLRLGASAERVVVSGNTKFDVRPPADWESRLAGLRRCLPRGVGPILMLASTHDNEESLILARAGRLRERFPGLLIVIAPRHVRRAGRIQALAESWGFRVVRLSRLQDPAGSPAAGFDVIVVDTMGELLSILAAADVVFVGGSLVDEGGHNLIEPACHGKAILMGPSVSNFEEIVAAFVAEKAVIVVKDPDELVARAGQLLEDQAGREELGRRAASVVERHIGSAAQFVRRVDQLAADSDTAPRRGEHG